MPLVDYLATTLINDIATGPHRLLYGGAVYIVLGESFIKAITGAAFGISLTEAACRILSEMATFGEAGISERESS